MAQGTCAKIHQFTSHRNTVVLITCNQSHSLFYQANQPEKNIAALRKPAVKIPPQLLSQISAAVKL
jgi:hypothetical protein